MTQQIADARQIAANATPNTSAALRTLAWAALKTARGQTISQTGLNRAANAGPARSDNPPAPKQVTQ
ncbi:MAG: hypothetical protein CMM86_09435 [Rhodovulum sp.]|nr:hypothetical protein [Rhodovulum sp.]|tara:strand:- start:483 stop:683 length:201 start_codon:yes stop_codon:yes gene_type:complete